MQRYFVQEINGSLRVSENDFHHIKDVMRLKEGDQLIAIFNNQSFLCSIHYKKDDYEIIQEKEVTTDVELAKDIILYQALIRNDKFDLVVQKASELGVKEIYPTICERCVVKVDTSKSDNKLLRYRKISKEASEQSHRQTIATINEYIKVNSISLDNSTLGLVAYENNDDIYSLKHTLSKMNDFDKIAIVIGPEGGFTQKEIDKLLQKGFYNVSLGKRILRSDTAAINSLSIIAHYVEGID